MHFVCVNIENAVVVLNVWCVKEEKTSWLSTTSNIYIFVGSQADGFIHNVSSRICFGYREERSPKARAEKKGRDKIKGLDPALGGSPRLKQGP